ncbi:hypothetical protein [Streptomyces sp. NPDC088760]|uniref:hypothetical protein n=1 Tax=Streptomyces sp. NPDC088760 TaxID=3365890 RepID=UPI00381595B6
MALTVVRAVAAVVVGDVRSGPSAVSVGRVVARGSVRRCTRGARGDEPAAVCAAPAAVRRAYQRRCVDGARSVAKAASAAMRPQPPP